MELTFLGCSDAQGVPRMACECAVCRGASLANHNRRSRSSVWLTADGHHALIDVSPDIRSQYVTHRNGVVPDVVFLTHAHNDHMGGLGDFGDYCFWNALNVPVVAAPEVMELVQDRYPYLKRRRGIEFVSATDYQLGAWHVTFHRTNHGYNGFSYAIVLQKPGQRWCYAVDAFDVPLPDLQPLMGADVLVMAATHWDESAAVRSHRSVYDVQEALALRHTLQPKRFVLTHLAHSIDWEAHTPLLPPGVELAYDGLRLTSQDIEGGHREHSDS